MHSKDYRLDSHDNLLHRGIFLSMLIQIILIALFYLSVYFQPFLQIASKMYQEKIEVIRANFEKPKDIFYVYHQGSMYIDPVDPKGERCLIPWDYTNDIKKAGLIMYNCMDNGGELSSPRDPRLRPDQATCMESMESGSYYKFVNTNRQAFNYTMYYSLTSDVPIPYAEYFESSEPSLPLSEKQGHLAAAFISNCGANNHRTEYLKELMKYMKIDSFGSCVHNADIPHEYQSHSRDQTKQKTISHYKFTLSFENSDDDDYITEKLYQPLRYGSVPVFRGCRNVEDFAPPHSVIDANTFSSAKDLADYLNYLDKNDTAYNEYLHWKETNNLGNLARVRFFRDRYEYGVCALVERMHGLWINPFLTDWKRVTDAEMGCNKCLDNFDVETRRIPYLREDGWTYIYPPPGTKKVPKLIPQVNQSTSFISSIPNPYSRFTKAFDIFAPFY